MDSRIHAALLVVFFQISVVIGETDPLEFSALISFKDIWKNYPPNWEGQDPCDDGWVGITCTDSHVTSISLANMNLEGRLSGDIDAFTELKILDLSYNKELKGPIPQNIGNLRNLNTLILVGCSFSGQIPDAIGSLKKLVFLSLNNNKFTGTIPASIGNLEELYWLDLAENEIGGNIPVSDGSSPGLDMLLKAKHFHLGQNKLSGKIPAKLFNSKMILIHALLDDNQLTGEIPESLGLVKALEVVRFDGNSLSGSLPSNLNNLTKIQEMYFSNNKLTGSLPNLTGLDTLFTLDLSNNRFASSVLPQWLTTLQTLSTLRLEGIGLEGGIPSTLFDLPVLQSVVLNGNRLNGSLDIGTGHSDQLELVDLQGNLIDDYKGEGEDKFILILADNPVCQESGKSKPYCSAIQTNSSYVTLPDNCLPSPCNSGQASSPTCRCAYPFTGTLIFRSPSFSGLRNSTYYESLEKSLMSWFGTYFPVDSVSLANATVIKRQLHINLSIFPAGQDGFNRTGVSVLAFALSNQTYKPPDIYGPFYFMAETYTHFTDATQGSKSSSTGVIIGAVAGGAVLVLLLIAAGIYAYRQKKRAERATEQSNPFAKWGPTNSSIDAPQLSGARSFSFEEMKKCTNNFADANTIGTGGYGKVYRGMLPTGQLVAIKRAQQGSLQGGLEFKTEIELLSRVHHKNVVGLKGFCFDRGEQMLIYEYVPNGSLRDSLSGKTAIRLEWTRRIKIALGAARGLAYLHELANPPIIHRDIKSNNILLDERLTSKVADFGLSKPVGDPEKTHVTTQVKGTLGYLDPEYYMTQQLTEKSDVYSFGVVMLELLTGRTPIERGKYVVREVKMKMDRTKSLYDLHEILDPIIVSGTSLKGFEKFVNVALKCVEESGSDRPSMGEVVKEIENIMMLAGMNPGTDSASSSATYEEASKGSQHPYDSSNFEYSGDFVPSKLEPQ